MVNEEAGKGLKQVIQLNFTRCVSDTQGRKQENGGGLDWGAFQVILVAYLCILGLHKRNGFNWEGL